MEYTTQNSIIHTLCVRMFMFSMIVHNTIPLSFTHDKFLPKTLDAFLCVHVCLCMWMRHYPQNLNFTNRAQLFQSSNSNTNTNTITTTFSFGWYNVYRTSNFAAKPKNLNLTTKYHLCCEFIRVLRFVDKDEKRNNHSYK